MFSKFSCVLYRVSRYWMLSHELTSIPVSVNEIFESIGIGAGIASSVKNQSLQAPGRKFM